MARAQAKSSAGSLLGEALALHQAGRLADAEKIYRTILAAEPAQFDALHLLGVVLHQRGDAAEAVRLIDRALKILPNDLRALNNRVLALKALQRFDDALMTYDRMLAVPPAQTDVLANKGQVLFTLRRQDEALASYDRALALKPDFAEALCNRAAVLHELKRPREALAGCDRALALDPNLAEAHANRGNALFALQRAQDALLSYDRAVALRPDNAEFHASRGIALQELLRYDESLASQQRALALRPDYPEAHFNCGNALHRLERFDEALTHYDRAIALRPDYAEAHANRGVTLHEMLRLGEALANYARALTLRPDFADVQYCEGLCRLLSGDLEGGWPKHEWRWRTEAFRNSRRDFSQELYLGADEISGKTILLHAEQGLGDTLQFCRYVPQAATRAGCVILEVQKPLLTLMRDNFPGVDVIARGDPLPDFDVHCPLLSLPLAFQTRLETIPAQVPYLAAPADKALHWRARFGAHDKPRIGLAWAGNPRKALPNANRIDRQRSMTFDRLAPLLAVAGCDFVSLQKGDDAVAQLRNSPARGRVIDWTDALHDFSDTAALIANLDLVIAVDTSVVHLAGALGKPFWLLNRANTCWRWLLDRTDSPWYPSGRQFRQDGTRDWDGVIAAVHAALNGYLRDWPNAAKKAG